MRPRPDLALRVERGVLWWRVGVGVRVRVRVRPHPQDLWVRRERTGRVEGWKETKARGDRGSRSGSARTPRDAQSGAREASPSAGSPQMRAMKRQRAGEPMSRWPIASQTATSGEVAVTSTRPAAGGLAWTPSSGSSSTEWSEAKPSSPVFG